MNPERLSSIARRRFLQTGGAGFVATAATALLADSVEPSAVTSGHKYARTVSQFPATAKSVIFLFMEGGPSHIDLFDPKPLLNQLSGQRLPDSFGDVITPMGESRSPLLASQRRWQRHGEAGTWVSDWLPHTAQCVDDIAVIRSCWADGINHSSGVCQMNTCSILGGRPSLGSWVSYGLGSENDNLPSFIVMQDNKSSVVNGPRNWSAGFMPAMYQGVRLNEGSEPIPNLNPPEGSGLSQQQSKLKLLDRLNRDFADQHPEQSELDARIAAYELAFRMQAQAPEAVAIDEETAETQALYGMDQKETATFGRMCLLSRRLVERGVRFVQLYHGAGSKWDAHSGIEANHSGLCRASDQPIAALLKDLKQRGLLDQTLVVWGGEFGRQPTAEYATGSGRDHNSYGFTVWMAGGGIKGGTTVGATDEIGSKAVEDVFHVRHMHATILTQLGLSPEKLTYFFGGLNNSLVGVEGAKPMWKIMT